MQLDEYQAEIVNSKEPRIIVEASAGAGKTRVLIERVKKLLLDDIEPHNMVIITFTNMAAEELKERLIDVPGIGDCFVGTIHSFANKILGNSGIEYKILNDELTDKYINIFINLCAQHLTFNTYLDMKEDIKKMDLGLLPEDTLHRKYTAGEVYELNFFMHQDPDKTYTRTLKSICKQNNTLTFDELLVQTTKYFKEINGKVEYLFVDEYQDIGTLEKKFFQALNADNYFYVGDEKQSLYRIQRWKSRIFLKFNQFT